MDGVGASTGTPALEQVGGPVVPSAGLAARRWATSWCGEEQAVNTNIALHDGQDGSPPTDQCVDATNDRDQVLWQIFGGPLKTCQEKECD